MQTTKQLKKPKLIYLPPHKCSCGKVYPFPGSLNNHIKIAENQLHSPKNRHYKIDRGVPEGRSRKFSVCEINQLKRIFSEKLKNAKNEENDVIS